MSASTQPKTFSDLYTWLLNRVREQTSVSATTSQAKSYINTGLQDMHIGYGERFPWAERRGRITTQAPYSTGTVAITKGSTTLTGAGTLWNTNNSFSVKNARKTGRIVIAGQSVVYDISAVGSDTSITLDSPFVGDTQTAATYLYFEDEYDLHADFLRPLDAQFFDLQQAIRITDRTTFKRKYPLNATTGKPLVACIVDRAFDASTTPIRRVRFWKPPGDEYSIPYSFVTNKLAVSSTGTALESLTSDDDEPIVPFQYRHAIGLYALYNWYRDKKDDARSAEAKAEYVDLIIRITGDTEIGERRPSLRPSMGGYRNRAAAPYGAGRSGNYTTGTRFDQMDPEY
jgi:hypothetical protein